MCSNHHDLLEMAVIESLPLRQINCPIFNDLQTVSVAPGVFLPVASTVSPSAESHRGQRLHGPVRGSLS
jgi:hypothetical protein